MVNLSVIGLQWGDEGKGKVVDHLSQHFDVVVRFQGGNNAGHTLNIDNQTYKLSLLPSGVARDHVLSIIDQGVVLDANYLIQEINSTPFHITPQNLLVSEDCHLILSLHRELDAIYEGWRGHDAIGTTCKGIGTCYEDKVARRGIRICDTYNKDDLAAKLKIFLKYHNMIRRESNLYEITAPHIMQEILDAVTKIKPYVVNRNKIIEACANSTVLFEGAQGCLLDLDYGTYPFVTSSSTSKVNDMTGRDNYVLGVAKSYATRVGNGPFPTEQENAIGDQIQKNGQEVGTVSGRIRRCGWLDIVLLDHAVRTSATDGLVLTKLDVLDGIKTIKICTGYQYAGVQYNYFPSDIAMQNNLQPIYKEIPGWQQPTNGMTDINQLSNNALNYIKTIESLINVPIVMISTGARREDVIMLNE